MTSRWTHHMSPAQLREYNDLSPAEAQHYDALRQHGHSHADTLQACRDLEAATMSEARICMILADLNAANKRDSAAQVGEFSGWTWEYILSLPEYDETETDKIDVGSSGQFVAGGELFRFDYERDQWDHRGAYIPD